MAKLSQETKDFLIIGTILLAGGVAYALWQNEKPTTDHNPISIVEPSYEITAPPSEHKIICKIDADLKPTTKCDKQGKFINFYTDKTKDEVLFELEIETLLAECEDQKCENVALSSDLIQIDTDPQAISLLLPHHTEAKTITNLIRRGLINTPPKIGDEIQIHMATLPDAVFTAQYAPPDIRADIINFRRNKNKVIRLYSAKNGKATKEDFVLESKKTFDSFPDFEAQLQTFLEENQSDLVKNIDLADFVQEIANTPKDGLTHTILMGLNDSIRFPKARSYALNAQGFGWFYTYQKRYNKGINSDNSACRNNRSSGCRYKTLWEETFTDYYVRHITPKVIEPLNFNYATNKIALQLLDLEEAPRSPLQTEREAILQGIRDRLLEKITQS